ncbi:MULTISPECIES: hypothetical protein [unclassified Micromonospora]|uniref:hypothetical protein n=1 Tax=unclassified Micromonospora TaxID=2617518 RepID=UPI003A864F95
MRTDAFEPAVSLLDDGPLGEVDGTEGRRLFVIEPAGAETLRIRAAEPNPDDSDACWQVRASGADPLTVVAADCVPSELRQRFSIGIVERAGGEPSYAISSASAYLQHSATRGADPRRAGRRDAHDVLPVRRHWSFAGATRPVRRCRRYG